MERLVLVVCLTIAVLSLGSCSRAGAYLAVARGNHAFVQGDYQKANIHYLHARELGGHPDWIAYDLGTLYYALGEPEVAEVEWNIAAETESPVLLALVAFNYGVHLFESGRYEDAYTSFRKALELNPDDINTKLNLEYCLQKIESHGNEQSTTEDSGNAEAGQEVQMILEYVRRKEEARWESTEVLDEKIEGRDW